MKIRVVRAESTRRLQISQVGYASSDMRSSFVQTSARPSAAGRSTGTAERMSGEMQNECMYAMCMCACERD